MSSTSTTTTTVEKSVARLDASGVYGEPSEPIHDLKPETKTQGNDSSFFEDIHFLGDKEGKVVIRSPPKFDNPEDQRAYQKQHLAVAFRVFARQGFDEGVAGHICK